MYVCDVCVLYGCIFTSHVNDCLFNRLLEKVRFGGGVVAGAPLHHTAPAESGCLDISPKSAQENVSRSETCGSK